MVNDMNIVTQGNHWNEERGFSWKGLNGAFRAGEIRRGEIEGSIRRIHAEGKAAVTAF